MFAVNWSARVWLCWYPRPHGECIGDGESVTSLVRPGRLYRAGAWVRLGAGYHVEAWLWELSELMELIELCALRMLWAVLRM